MTASGSSPHHQTSVTKAILVQQDLQAQWVFKELQDQQVHAVRQVLKEYVAKQAQLVYKDQPVQQAPQVRQARKDF
jgi:ribosomal protein S13